MLKKIFELWNKKKIKVQENNNTIFIKQREIVFINMGKNIGYEQDGKGEEFLRPVIIYKKFNNNIFLGIPLTSTIKNNKFYYNFEFESKSKKKRQSSAILSQVRLFDTKRVKFKLGTINKKDFYDLHNKFTDLIKPNDLDINTPKGESPEGICNNSISQNIKEVKYE